MDKRRDNEIARDIISGKITELYCIKPGFSNQILFGQKYKVYVNWKWSNFSGTILSGRNVDKYKIYSIGIYDNSGNPYPFISDTSISDCFETSLKCVRKNKLKKINQYQGF